METHLFIRGADELSGFEDLVSIAMIQLDSRALAKRVIINLGKFNCMHLIINTQQLGICIFT